MRPLAEKLRWILLTGAVLLACALAALFGVANYRAGRIWQRILARNGVNLRQETDGFTYSQSDGKRTIFTLHASKALPQGKGKWSLSNAVLVLYAKDGRTDRIYGSQFDYDQEAGVARAAGEVHLDLQAPAAAKGAPAEAAPDLSFHPGDDPADDAVSGRLIHVRTSGLVYTRKLGLAATTEEAEFRYRGMTCTAHGAEFDSGKNILRLLADVHLNGSLREAPFALTAARADLDRGTNVVELLRPVLVSEDRHARADRAVLHLRPGGSMEAGDATGAVELRTGTEVVAASALHGDFDAENRPQHGLLSGGVRYLDVDARQMTQGAAKSLDLALTEAGVLRTATAEGGVSLSTKIPASPSPAVKNVAASGAVARATSTREMRAQRAVASFVPGSGSREHAVLRTLHLWNGAEVTAETPPIVTGTAAASTQVHADDLLMSFTETGRTPQPTGMLGVGHTLLEQHGADGGHQTSTGERLNVRFAERLHNSSPAGGEGVEVASATQTGDVVLRSWAAAARRGDAAAEPAVNGAAKAATASGSEDAGSLTVGHAQGAVYEAATGTLTLTASGGGGADVYDGSTQIAAPTIVLHEGTGDGEASGGVVATTGGADGEPATHVLAARAALLHKSGLTKFFGTDTQPARLWQAGSQVRAATLVLDGQRHGLSARPEGKGGTVEAVFANARPTAVKPLAQLTTERSGTGRPSPARGEGPLGGNLPEASRDAVEIRAATMDYNDASREALFGGGVRLRGAEGDITGEHGAAFLESAAVPDAEKAKAQPGGTAVGEIGGRLQRFVVLGNVRMEQPGRSGVGEQLTYTAATNTFALTGSGSHPPQVHDAQQGLVTGDTLVFGAADSSIVVAGTPGASKQATAKGSKPARVHTETDLKQQ